MSLRHPFVPWRSTIVNTTMVITILGYRMQSSIEPTSLLVCSTQSLRVGPISRSPHRNRILY